MRRLWHALLALIALFFLALAGLWTAGRLSPGYTLDIGGDEWGRIQDANDWEEHGSYTYRWTRAATAFRLPYLGAPRMVTVRLDGTRPAGVPPAEVTLSLDGQDLVTLTPSAGPALYHLAYDVPGAWRWETVVAVRATPFTLPDDPRLLGVVVDRLHFSPPLRPPAPPWLLAVLWTAVGFAAAALAHLLEWPLPWRGVLPVAVVVGLIALYGSARPVALSWAGLLLAVWGLAAVVAWRFRARRGEDEAPEIPGAMALRMDAFVGACLALAVLAAFFPLVTPLLGGDKSWGLKLLEPFYPQAGLLPRAVERLLPLFVVALAAVPAVNRDLVLLGAWLGRAWRRATWRLRPAGRWLLLGLLFVPVEYLLRARILWGDGPHLISRVAAGYLFSEPEMLPFFLHAVLYRWTARLWGWSVPDVYTVVSLFAGALYVALAAALGDTLGRNRLEKGLIAGLVMTLATVQFGFGYLENYGFVTVALLALFWQMARCLQGRSAPAAVAALWVIACACHLQALLVGPAVGYTVLRAWRAGGWKWRQIGPALLAGLLTAGLLLGLFLAAGYDLGHLFRGDWVRGNNDYFFVPLRSDETYTLFSWTHLLNLVNEHLLVAPVVLPLLVLVVVCYRRRVPWRDPVTIALALGAAGLVLFASTLYPDLSAAMDWDLFAPSALPYTLLTGYLFARAVPEGRGKEYAALVLLCSAGAHAALWVLLNAGLL